MLLADNTVTVVALSEWLVRYGTIPAFSVILRSIFSSVLWPTLHASYQMELVVWLNFAALAFFGLWNKAPWFGFRWLKNTLRTFTGHFLEFPSENILPSEWSSDPSRPPVWFLLVRTTPGWSLFNSKYSWPFAVLTRWNQHSLVFSSSFTKIDRYEEPRSL